MQKLMNGPLRNIVANKARKAGRRKGAARALSRTLRDHRYLAESQRQRARRGRGDGGDLRFGDGQEPGAGVLPAGAAQGFRQGLRIRRAAVHVVGPGVMGGDIAAWCALRGMTVTLQDQSVERIAPAIARAAKLFERRFRNDARQARFALDRLIPDPQGHGVTRADVIIEAIFENLEAKQGLFADIERRARPQAVLASTPPACGSRTSPRAAGSGAAGRHPLLQSGGDAAAGRGCERGAVRPATVARAMAFVRGIDKLPLPVKSAPGFLVNAVLGPYMLEALRCVDEGLPRSHRCGAGGFRHAHRSGGTGRYGGPGYRDGGGQDAGRRRGGQAAAPAGRTSRRWQAGPQERRGFYRWVDGKAQKATVGSIPAGLAERIIEPLLEATRRCVAEGVVADADLADAGVIFGTGFAPFTGGPMNYLRGRDAGRNPTHARPQPCWRPITEACRRQEHERSGERIAR